jgi:hypothetical protein
MAMKESFMVLDFGLKHYCCSVHGFVQAKFAHGSLILGQSQFILLPQLPLKTMLG